MFDSARPSRGRATMVDVAAAAEVSVKTVSRVVNGDAYVGRDTAERVQTAIRTLGFRRNESARQLRAGSAATIGIVLEDAADPFYSSLTRSVEEVAFGHSHMLLAASSAEDPQRARSLIEAFIARGVDGLIVTPAEGMDVEFLEQEIAAGVRMVFVDRPVVGLDVDTVLVDNLGGARRAAEHLLRHGHRRVAYFGDDEKVYTAGERCAGYRAALVASELVIDERLVVMRSPDPSGAHELARMLESADPPTAVLSGNNRWSVQLLRALRERTERLAFVGFDDFELADVLSPAVTVIAQNSSAIGTLTAELLFRRIGGDTSPPQRIQLGTRLIQRGSGEFAPAGGSGGTGVGRG